MRCVAGHQANLYPYGGFFAKAASVDRFVIVDTTQYVKKEYHNRNRVKIAPGVEHWLTIPVKTAGRFDQALGEVEILPGSRWRKDHRRCLEVSYARSPFFEGLYPPFQALLSREWRMLTDYTIAVITTCLELLEIPTPVAIASRLGVEGKSSDLILDICRKTGCDTYLHGKHGRDYVDFELLSRAGIRNLLQEYRQATYPQPWGDFLPNMCILDILFNCGPDCLAILRSGRG